MSRHEPDTHLTDGQSLPLSAQQTSLAGMALAPRGGDQGTLASLARRRNWRARDLIVHLLPDLIVVSWLIWLFDAINNLAPVRQGLAERDGESLLRLEHSLRLDPELALNKWTASHNALSQIAVFWYENVHIVVTLVVFAWLWWRRADLLRSMRATLIGVNLIALAVFWSFPVAPPRMLSGGYVDLVAAIHHLPTWQLGAIALDSNQLCSMPSLHIAWAVWSSLALWRLSGRWWLRALAVIYPLLTTFAVMATANHYLADALMGAALTLAVHLLLGHGSWVRRLAAGAMRTASKITN